MTRSEVRTTFALQATALSAQFNELFGTVKIPPGYVADLTAPDGPSTGGGAQAIQHVRLRGPDGGPPLMMGSLDPSQMRAVVRTHAHLSRQARSRGTTLNLDARDYAAFCDRIQKFYEGLHFIVEVEDAPLETPATSAQTRRLPAIVPPGAVTASAGGGSFWSGFVVGALIFGSLAAGITYVLLTHR